MGFVPVCADPAFAFGNMHCMYVLFSGTYATVMRQTQATSTTSTSTVSVSTTTSQSWTFTSSSTTHTVTSTTLTSTTSTTSSTRTSTVSDTTTLSTSSSSTSSVTTITTTRTTTSSSTSTSTSEMELVNTSNRTFNESQTSTTEFIPWSLIDSEESDASPDQSDESDTVVKDEGHAMSAMSMSDHSKVVAATREGSPSPSTLSRGLATKEEWSSDFTEAPSFHLRGVASRDVADPAMSRPGYWMIFYDFACVMTCTARSICGCMSMQGTQYVTILWMRCNWPIVSGLEVQTTPAQSTKMPAKMQAMAAENNSQIIKYTLTRVVPRIAVRACCYGHFFAYLVNCFRLFSSTEWPNWSGDSKPELHPSLHLYTHLIKLGQMFGKNPTLAHLPGMLLKLWHLYVLIFIYQKVSTTSSGIFTDTFLTWSHTQVVLFPFVFVSKSDLGGYPIDLLRLRDACPHCLVVIEYSKIYAWKRK